MVQWFRALTALREHLGLILRTHMVAHNCLLTQVPRDPILRVPGRQIDLKKKKNFTKYRSDIQLTHSVLIIHSVQFLEIWNPSMRKIINGHSIRRRVHQFFGKCRSEILPLFKSSTKLSPDKHQQSRTYARHWWTQSLTKWIHEPHFKIRPTIQHISKFATNFRTKT